MSRDSLSLREVIEEFAGVLESAGIPYMVIGGYAVILHIPYRDTFDGDFVVARMDADKIQIFADLIEDSDIFSIDEREARDVLAHGGKFIVFSKRYGIHVFVWRKDFSDLSEKEAGLSVATPEFLIVEKLRLIKDGDADAEDKDDVVALLTSPAVSLDDGALANLAKEYGVTGLLNSYEKRASKAKPEDFTERGESEEGRVEQVARMWKNEKSYKEMADELGIAQSTVGVYVARARERGLISEKHRK